MLPMADFSHVVPGLHIGTTGHLVEMQIPGPDFRPPQSKLLRWGPEICVFINPPKDSDAHSSVKTTAMMDNVRV